MHPESALEEMNNLIGKMDRNLKSLNKELDDILKKYPRYLEDQSDKLSYELYKYVNGK